MIAIDKEMSAIRDTAADWVVQLNDSGLSAAERKTFSEWLCRSPIHVREYLRAEGAWQAMASAAKEDPSEVRQVLASVPSNVLEWPRQTQEANLPSRRGFAGRRLAAAVAAAIVLAVGALFGPQILERLNPNVYSTALGEMRHVVLPDGSSVDLNTRSKIHVSMGETAREVYLYEGQAYFQVAKDPSRPFRVRSEDTVVRALGTQFDVYRKSNGTAIAVVEGLVSIAPDARVSRASPASDAAPLKLKAGEGAFVRRQTGAVAKPLQAARIDSRRAVSWRQRRLIFENESLAEVVAEFNRYNSAQLSIQDPALAAARVSGVFNAQRPRALVDFLTQHGEVRATDLPGSRILLSKREKSE
jgi:transmembrane sensor